MSFHSKHTAQHITSRTRRHGLPVAALLSTLLLAACGGGGGSAGDTSFGGGTATGGTGAGGTTATAAGAVTVGMVDGNGAATTTLTSATPLTVQATVLDNSKKPVPNALVTFTTDNNLAVFTPASGTALTDAKGIATISMRSASLSAAGAATVTATATVAGATTKGSGNFSVGATTVTFGPLTAQPANIQAYGSTLLSVDVLSGSTKYTEQQVNVTFTSACVTSGKATLSAVAATNGGTAQTVYRDKGCGTGDVVTASAPGVSKSVSTTVQVAPPTAASLQFVQAEPLNQSIVIQGQGGNGRTETATLTFKVVDTSGNPITGREVFFSTTSTNVKVNSPSGITDSEGKVITTVNSGAVPTSFRVLATLPKASASGGDLTTQSDSIVVTTGVAVQRAFSISVGKFNVDGWDFDSPPDKPATHINLLVADTNGNPVADGTPIVVQTNMGSVGSADRGGCNTVNGGCSVDFRTQEPRHPVQGQPATPCNTGPKAVPDSTRKGVATVCASSTDGVNVITALAYVGFSSNTPGYIYIDGSETAINLANLAGPIDLGTTSGGKVKTFVIELDDVNQNPMPQGTTLTLLGATNLTLQQPSSATVPNMLPDPFKTTHQGTKHAFGVYSGTDAATCKAADATFTLDITTPRLDTYHIPFKLKFTCP